MPGRAPILYGSDCNEFQSSSINAIAIGARGESHYLEKNGGTKLHRCARVRRVFILSFAVLARTYFTKSLKGVNCIVMFFV